MADLDETRHSSRTSTDQVQIALQVSRRAGLGMLAAGAALLTRTAPTEAAYGESANIFGKATNTAGALSSHWSLLVSLVHPPFPRWIIAGHELHHAGAGFVPYAGEGYALLLPSKWNPSKERDFPGVELR